MGRTVMIVQPLNGWEAGLITDAARMKEGLPVYVDYTEEHAAPVYAPFLQFLSSQLF